MSDQEKTQQPTEHRREEFRKKGDVAKSRELVSIGVLLAGFLALYFFVGWMIELYNELQLFTFQRINFSVKSDNIGQVLSFPVFQMFKMLMPFFIAVIVVAIAANVGQTGFLVSENAFKFDFSRINPASKFKQIFFSKQSFFELFKAILKLAIVGLLSWFVILSSIGLIIDSLQRQIPDILSITGSFVFKLVLNSLILLLFLGFADFIFQKLQMEEKMKMTHQEVKDEYKQMEGDPFIKSKRRSKQREISMNRMMQEVPQADVIVTNPTHFAVALRYDRKKDRAPIVVAKGADFMAQKIKEVARESGVQIVENKMLARALYWNVEIGDSIPESLFKAVAELLAYVYKINREKGRRWLS
ncbi:flagellar biosynthesis protein FlhB [bacterium]|nr:flagellar biosynthesis protein FlhB [bacterium]